jgi:hypothetical protein
MRRRQQELRVQAKLGFALDSVKNVDQKRPGVAGVEEKD